MPIMSAIGGEADIAKGKNTGLIEPVSLTGRNHLRIQSFSRLPEVAFVRLGLATGERRHRRILSEY